MFLRFIGGIFIGALVGYLAERFGLTRNGYVVSVAIGVGGAVLFWLMGAMFGIRLGLGHAAGAFVGSAVLLFLASMRR